MSVATSAAHGQSREALADAARAFDESALRAADNNAKPMPIRKWMMPIKLAFHNPSARPSLVDETRQDLRILAAEAGVDIVDVADPASGANYVVYFDENGLNGQAGWCWANGWWGKDGAMTKGEMRINPTRKDTDRCIIHEGMHSIGFLSHPHGAFSVLSYVYKAQRTLTPLDKNLIHTLYDPRMTTGMKTAPASQLACRILGERMAVPAADIEAVCRDRKGPSI